ncbi:MAG: Eco57I restriction-modification methylase domain-containing protein [Anaerolineales bacterium]|nr:MAG: Eco57I restriction-modification methylase domain-containing protein [Anaerolineales bacterium]
MPAPDIIKQLVERFEQHHTAYRAGRYNETQLRREFLDPFFEALGWDVFNKLGYSEDHKHVIHEDSLEIEGVKKAPDYAFKVGRERKFFVEAKKPSVKIETNPEVAFQLRRYVWSAKLPLGILTDFEEFAVYECRSKPQVSDSVKTGRVMLFKYTDYIEKWDEIAAIFSHEAVMKGQFDQFANSTAKKKGTAEVDSAFLDEIEGWREALAKNVALRNRDKVRSEADLNYAVQMTIDRVIFLRICEDRGFESENQLQELAKRENIYEGLKSLFEKADRRYNSGLFHFKDETGRGRADTFTTSLEIDDKVLKDVIRDLYYPSPYVFSQIPADILGQIYEQFLGKVIRLTAGGSAKVEEKPEVRKAGGVFYTPTFIVDYIVGNTLGKLLEGKTPEQAAKLRIVDPACGSGTFLLGAYQYLLDWHLDWYLNNDPEKWAKGKNPALVSLPQLRSSIGAGQGGGWKLSVAKKKEILLNNLYGVDIDPQAVEVTKLSLLLKVIEDPGQLTFLDERILPDLGRNIQCGNSLIGPDYWEGQLLVSDEDRVRVNAFDWQAAFPGVFAQGGFDAVVGNPPYIRIQAMREWASEQVEYYAKKYKAASKGNYDIYVVFVEKALSLLNTKGRLGFILPHKFFNAKYGEPLRGIIAKGKHLSKVVHFGDQQVFKGATTYTCLMFLNKQASAEFEFTKVSNLEDWRNQQTSEVSDIVPVGGTSEVSGMINASRVTESEWNFTVGKGAGLFTKLSEMPVKLGDIAYIFVGLQTSADTVFLFKDTQLTNSSAINVYSKELDQNVEIETGLLKPVIRSGEIGRYWASPSALVLFPYETKNSKSKLKTESDIQKEYPKTWDYLLTNKKILSEREHGKFKDIGWYQLYPKNLDTWEQPKIMLPYMITRLSAFYDESNHYFVNVTTGGFGVTIDEKFGTQKYITGLLNSKLLDWFMKHVSTSFHGGYFAANKQFLVQLPIRPINFSDPADKARHDKMVTLVERMLALHKSLASAHNPHEADRLTREVESTDREIDRLVYELYGLTEEEIKIVEG